LASGEKPEADRQRAYAKFGNVSVIKKTKQKKPAKPKRSPKKPSSLKAKSSSNKPVMSPYGFIIKPPFYG